MTLRLPRLLRATLPLAVLALGACAQTFDATALGVPATLASDAATPAQGVRFDAKATQLWFGWGLLPVNDPSLKAMLAAQLVGGQSVADVKIRLHTRLTDLLVSAITLGLLIPRAVEFEGVIVGDANAPAAVAPAPVPTPATPALPPSTAPVKP